LPRRQIFVSERDFLSFTPKTQHKLKRIEKYGKRANKKKKKKGRVLFRDEGGMRFTLGSV